jgi:hypothetical protein
MGAAMAFSAIMDAVDQTEPQRQDHQGDHHCGLARPGRPEATEEDTRIKGH